MKRILPVVVVLVILVMGGSAAQALTPVFATENVTWVASDNFTMSIADNITITGLEQMIVAAAEVHAQGMADSQTDVFEDAIGLLLVLVLTWLAYWQRLPLLYVLSGLSMITYGFAYFSSSVQMSIILVVIGIFNFAMAKMDRVQGG